MRQLKTVLLNQYIGAIATGYLIGRGMEAFFAALMPTVNTILTEAIGGQTPREGAWVSARINLFSNLTLAAWYFVVAYLMAIWLYSKVDTD